MNRAREVLLGIALVAGACVFVSLCAWGISSLMMHYMDKEPQVEEPLDSPEAAKLLKELKALSTELDDCQIQIGEAAVLFRPQLHKGQVLRDLMGQDAVNAEQLFQKIRTKAQELEAQLKTLSPGEQEESRQLLKELRDRTALLERMLQLGSSGKSTKPQPDRSGPNGQPGRPGA